MFAVLSTQATINQILLREGLLTGAEAVAWADGWLMRLDELPDELISSWRVMTMLSPRLEGVTKSSSGRR